MTFATVAVGIGTAVVGSYAQNRAARRAADAVRAGTDAATYEQRRQFDMTRQDMLPWMQQGGWALDQQRQFLEGNWSGFQNSPDYKFAVEQGFKGLERGFAAGGATGSGGADADRIAYGQGLATQYAGNYYAKLAGLSNTGQQTAEQIGQFGANAATNIGNNFINAGNARASAYINQGNNWANLANTVGQYGMYAYGRRG